MCKLSLYMKQALQAAGRRDVFLYYNDGPGSHMLSSGLCAGLDYWSLDSYQDSGEAAGVESLYAQVLPKLRGPNPLEVHGQGLFLVPGTYWYIESCHASCTAQPLGPGPQPHGCCLHGQAAWVVSKLEEYYAYYRRTQHALVGFNAWHWEDAPSLQPASFSRGAKTLGPVLWAAVRRVSGNVTAPQ